jgi:hypothetical protein
MPLDPSIPLQSGKGQPDPLETAARIFTIKAASQQAQLGDYKLKDQMTLRDVSALPSVKDEKGNVNYQALLQEGLNRGIGPDTVMTLNAAAQKQQEFKQSQQKFKTDQMTSFIKQSADPMAAIYTEFQQDSTKVGPEKAWEIAQPKTEALRQQLSQTFPDMKLQPMQSPDQLHAAAMHSEALVKNIARSSQPETPHEGRMAGAAEERNKIAAGKAAEAAKSFEGDNGKLMAALAERGVSLPTGFRSKAQQVALLNGLRERNKGKSVDQIAELVKSGTISLSSEKKETQTAAAVAGRVGVAGEEISQFAPLVEEASKKVPRGSFVPINKLLQTGEASISDPNLKKLKVYINSTLNAYDQLAARGGTDKDKRAEAHALLTTAESHEALMSGLQAFQKEVVAAQKAADIASRPRSEREAARKGDQPKGKRKVYNPATGKIEEQ